MATTSQPTRVVADPAARLAAPRWRWTRIVVWSVILAGCTAFWAGVVAVLLAL